MRSWLGRRRRSRQGLARDRWFAVDGRQWLSGGAWQRLTGFGVGKIRFRGLPLRSWLGQQRRSRQGLACDRWLAVDGRLRLSGSVWQRLTGFGVGTSRFGGLSLRSWLGRRRRSRQELARDGWLAVDGWQWLSGSAGQRLTGLDVGKRCFRGRSLRSRLGRRRGSGRRLAHDWRLAIYRWRHSGRHLTGRQSVWRSFILNRDRFWSNRWRKRRCQQSGGAGTSNTRTCNAGVGRRRF